MREPAKLQSHQNRHPNLTLYSTLMVTFLGVVLIFHRNCRNFIDTTICFDFAQIYLNLNGTQALKNKWYICVFKRLQFCHNMVFWCPNFSQSVSSPTDLPYIETDISFDRNFHHVLAIMEVIILITPCESSDETFVNTSHRHSLSVWNMSNGSVSQLFLPGGDQPKRRLFAHML